MPPARRDQPVGELFAALARSGDPVIRDAIIERHLPLARSLAARYRYTPQPLEDLVQVACVGLIKAVDGFDVSRGTSFASFAVPTIVGELRRSMRVTAWAVHVPRSLQERVVVVQRAERALSARSGSAPTVPELAQAAGLSVEEVLEAFAASNARDAMSLDGVASAAGSARRERDDEQALAAIDDRLALSDAIAVLPERERAILRLRFVDGLAQSEIGRRVGLSQMQVSRILRATLDTLRAELGS